MNQNTKLCDQSLAKQFLDQQLGWEENERFEDHLESCPQCRQSLESAAANDDVWMEVRESLGSTGLKSNAFHSSPSQSGPLSDHDICSSIDRESIRSWLSPTDDDRMMGRIGAYEVVGIVGTSSMAVVLKAFESTLDRYVAIKVLAPWLHANGSARQRFSREAQAAAAVVHENVIEIHCVSQSNELPYLVMPFVNGPSLQRRLNDQGPLELPEVLRIGLQAARGLAAAHDQGLVHRDVKPSNIMLSDGTERVKLTDFGLARAVDDASLTRTGVIAGTPQYMSPEQVRGEDVNQKSDLFSLGSVLYAMCAGRPPFRAETSFGVMRKVTDAEPRPIREINSAIPEWMARVVSKLMAKDAQQRYESADQVANVMQQCLAHVQQPTVSPLPESLTRRSANRSVAMRPWSVAAMVGLCALTICALLFFLNLGPFGSNPDNSMAGDLTIPKKANETKELTPSTASASAHDELTEDEMPKQLSQFSDITTGNYATIAISPDGSQTVLANRHPTMNMGGGRQGKVDVKGWKPVIKVMGAETGILKKQLPIAEPETLEALAETNPLPYLQAEAIKFSPDGSLIVVGTNAGHVRIFDAATGDLVRQLADLKGREPDGKTPEAWRNQLRAMGSVKSLAFSPDGTRLATVGGSFADFAESFDKVQRLGFRSSAPGRLKIWNVETGELIHDLDGHSDFVTDVAFSPDGLTLASAGRWSTDHERFGNGVIIWSAKTGAQRHYIRSTANGGVHTLSFSPDSKRLAFGAMRFGDGDDRSGGISFVNVSTGEVSWLVTVPGWANSLRFLPDGKHVAAHCGDSSIRFLNTEDGSLAHEITQAKTSSKRSWKHMAMGSDRFAIATVNKQNIGFEVWDARGLDSRQDEEGQEQQGEDANSEATHFGNLSEAERLSCCKVSGNWSSILTAPYLHL